MTKVVCGVIRSEKGYLIAQKKESLLWEFPGGKIQDGETDNQALQSPVTLFPCFWPSPLGRY